MICVYPSDCTDFSNNGLGPVQPQSCTVTETLNGEWELTLVHPIDDRGRWTRLTEGRILRAPVPAAMTPQVRLVSQSAGYDIYKVSTIRDPLRLRSGTGTSYKILGKYQKGTEVIVLAKTSSTWYEVSCPDGRHGYMSAEYLTFVRSTSTPAQATGEVIESRQLRDQPFRIYRVVPELDKVTVYARHVFYDLLDNMIQKIEPSASAVGASVAQSISSGCISSHDFTFYSDLTSTAEDVCFENINPVEAILGEGGMAEKYGAELARDWFDVFLVRRMGHDTDVHIREKKNLTGISYDVDETDVVTRIMPTGEDADGNILYLPELYVDSPNIGSYVHPKWIHLPVSAAKEVAEGENYKSLTECYQEMRNAARAEYEKGCDLPTVTLKVDFINCADTVEYAQYRNPNGVMTSNVGISIPVSDDLFAHSGNGANIRISFDIKRTNINAASAATAGVYSGIWVYYRYYGGDNGTTLYVTGRGWFLRATDANFVATDDDWVRVRYGPLNLASFNPVSIAYFYLGTASSNGMTGTVQFRNVKLEVLDAWTDWSAAPEDIYGLAKRMTNAESNITQNANNLALKVSTAAYNMEKVYRSGVAPTTLYTDMLWLDMSVSPNLLKRYTGSAWVVAGAQEVKSSGIYIGPNRVSITTENFLLQLLDPANNENVLMEMSANGNVGFNQLYADEIISDSVAAAYGGPETIYINTSYSGASDTYFRSLGEAVKAVNNRFLKGNVTIYLPSTSGEIYEPAGTQIQGVSGPGRLTIYGYSACRLNSYISVKGCSAHIAFQNMSLREIRPLNGGNRNSFMIDLQMNHHVEFNNCTLDANNVTYDSIYCRTTHAYLLNCGLYNAEQGLEVFMGWAYTKNCKGSCSWAMVAYAGYIIASGTVPNGSRGTGDNGQLFATGVTVDYGTAIPVVTPDSTTVQYATLTKSYRGGWRSDTTDVIQGVYYDGGYYSGLSWNYGCMWFGYLRSTLSNATIKSATLTLHRKTGSGSFSARTVYLCAIANTYASGSPNIVASFGGIGTIGRDTQVTFAIPIAAVQGLANGTYGGLCLYEPPYSFGLSTFSDCYMRMSGADTSLEPYLTVVYNDPTALG